MVETLRNYINGEWVASSGGELLEVRNPALDEVIARVPLSRPEEVDHAVAAARAAFETWRHVPLPARARYLLRLRDLRQRRLPLHPGREGRPHLQVAGAGGQRGDQHRGGRPHRPLPLRRPEELLFRGPPRPGHGHPVFLHRPEGGHHPMVLIPATSWRRRSASGRGSRGAFGRSPLHRRRSITSIWMWPMGRSPEGAPGPPRWRSRKGPG